MAESKTESRPVLAWTKLPSVPDHEGFASPFAGVSAGALIVAGGANFPAKRPWEGGTKVWYDSVFVLETPAGQWKGGFKLPRPIAYGLSVTTADGVICIGGGDAHRHYQDVLRLQWSDGAVQTSVLPGLPKPCAFMSGALVGQTIYVAGGIETPDATEAMKGFWALDLSVKEPRWEELPAWPGPERMLAAAGACDGSFYLFSGARLKAGVDGKPVREWLRDAYRFTPGHGWRRIADLPRAAVAAPSPVPVVGGRLLLLGGDDGTQVYVSPGAHKGFPGDVLAYDAKVDAWSVAGEMPAPRVTLPCTEWRGGFALPNGEMRPGIRSPEVWMLQPAR